MQGAGLCKSKDKMAWCLVRCGCQANKDRAGAKQGFGVWFLCCAWFRVLCLVHVQECGCYVQAMVRFLVFGAVLSAMVGCKVKVLGSCAKRIRIGKG